MSPPVQNGRFPSKYFNLTKTFFLEQNFFQELGTNLKKKGQNSRKKVHNSRIRRNTQEKRNKTQEKWYKT